MVSNSTTLKLQITGITFVDLGGGAKALRLALHGTATSRIRMWDENGLASVNTTVATAHFRRSATPHYEQPDNLVRVDLKFADADLIKWKQIGRLIFLKNEIRGDNNFGEQKNGGGAVDNEWWIIVQNLKF